MYIFKYIIKYHKANPQLMDNEERTPLHFAAQFNNLDIVKSWKFRPTKEDNEVMKEPLSKEDKELLEREIEVDE